jgi:DNA-binding response OmpR family regulator
VSRILEGKFILVVDDEELLREIIIDELTSSGANAFGVKNGKLALEAIRRKTFDAVITDLGMSGGDGLALIRDIQTTIEIKPKVFIFSGSDSISDQEVKALDICAVFGKPFDLGEMMTTIASFLN